MQRVGVGCPSRNAPTTSHLHDCCCCTSAPDTRHSRRAIRIENTVIIVALQPGAATVAERLSGTRRARTVRKCTVQQPTKTMPSIAAFIQGLLAEDMYATGMIENMDQRCVEWKSNTQWNHGRPCLLFLVRTGTIVVHGCNPGTRWV